MGHDHHFDMRYRGSRLRDGIVQHRNVVEQRLLGRGRLNLHTGRDAVARRGDLDLHFTERRRLQADAQLASRVETRPQIALHPVDEFLRPL